MTKASPQQQIDEFWRRFFEAATAEAGRRQRRTLQNGDQIQDNDDADTETAGSR